MAQPSAPLRVARATCRAAPTAAAAGGAHRRDADCFKPLNDALGPLHGDECLRELARLCGEFAQGDALLARSGGEELVL